MHLVMQGFTELQEAERFFHDKEFRLCRTLLVERNKHTEDFGQQKNLLMRAGALFMGLIATHCPSITKDSISSLQKKKTSGNVSQWFSTCYSPFLLCLPLGDAAKKVSCCSLNRNKKENKPSSLELVYTFKKNHQFRSQLLQGLDLIFGKRANL